MVRHELLENVQLAQSRLSELRERLQRPGDSAGAPELVGALGELQSLLGNLHAGYGLLHEILDRTSDFVFAKDLDGRYAMVNPHGAERIGRTVEQVVGAGDAELFDAEGAASVSAVDREVMATGTARTRDESLTVSGARRIWLVTTAAWYDGERRVRGVLGIAQDVTERRRSEREVATQRDRASMLAGELVLSEERLRRTLAAELHNGLAQDIALAKLRLSMLRESASSELRAPLGGIELLVERADRSLRSITFQLSPPSLHDLGLVAALQWLVEDIAQRYSTQVRLDDDGSPSVLDERVRIILFRAVRELLINVATHSRVGAAVVSLAPNQGNVRVTVRDTGAGFDPATAEPRGYGLFGIREQLKFVGGSMEIASAPNRGTTVTLTAPVAAPVVASAGAHG